MNTADAPPAIEVRGLVKDYPLGWGRGRLRAVDDLSLAVRPGEVFGLLGPNGSGKSTTIKVLLGLARPTRGECHVLGRDVRAAAARAALGYLPEAPDFPRHLTGRELVRFFGGLSGLAGPALAAATGAAITRVGLAAAADRRLATYSKGMLQRIGLAQAIVHQPEVLVLDEPTAGVDPVGSAEMARLILALRAEGRTILVTSHLLAQMEEICDRVAILHAGRLLACGTVAELAGGGAGGTWLVTGLPPGGETELRAWLQERGARLEPGPGGARLDRVFLGRVASPGGEEGR